MGIIVGLIVLIGAIIGFKALHNTEEKKIRYDSWGKILRDSEGNTMYNITYPARKFAPFALLAGVVIFVFSIVASCIVTVQTGQTGIVKTFGKVEDYTFEAGVHFIAPWQNVVTMDNRVQKATVDMSAFSSDIQEVSVKYTVNYQIDKATAMNIYKNIGTDYYNNVITPCLTEAVKTITALYTAESLINQRAVLASGIETLLSESLKRYDIVVISTSIEDLDFTDAFTNAVEAKQVAAQNKLQAEIEQAQKVMEAEQAAARAKIEAEAAAEVAKIQAQADLEVQKIGADAAEYAGQKEAAMNKILSENLNQSLLDYYYIKQWNGQLPEYYVGSDNVSAIVGMGE